MRALLLTPLLDPFTISNIHFIFQHSNMSSSSIQFLHESTSEWTWFISSKIRCSLCCGLSPWELLKYSTLCCHHYFFCLLLLDNIISKFFNRHPVQPLQFPASIIEHDIVNVLNACTITPWLRLNLSLEIFM